MEKLAGFWLQYRNVLLISGSVIGILATAGSVWWQQLTILPERPLVPAMVLPHPNAYDYYLQAASLQVDSKNLDLNMKMSSKQIGTLMPKSIDFLHTNAPAIQKLHEGASYSYRMRPEWEYNLSSPLSNFRRSARLLAFAGHVAEEQGQPTEAVSYYLDAIRLGIDIPHGGDILALQVEESMETMGRSRMWELTNRLNGSNARSAAKRLEDICLQRVSLADAFVVDKWHDETILWNMLQKDNPFRLTHKGYFLPDLGVDAAGEPIEPKLGDYLKQDSRFLFRSERYIFSEADHIEDISIERARLKSYSPHPKPFPIADNPISASIAPTLKIFRYMDVRDRDTRMNDALLLTKLALRAYNCDHQKYPSDLSALVTEGYLSQIPTDPFSPTCASIRFRLLSTGRYLLYSVGPDGIDDGGKPIDFPQPRHFYANRGDAYLEEDDLGDFVVGIDTP